MTCSVDRCTTKASKKGLCHTHYEYRRRTGREPYLRDDLGRLMAMVKKTPDGCWTFTGSLSKGRGNRGEGYGRIRFQGQYAGAHRAAYLMLVGPIPEGYHIDHLCKNRACCNPAHLEAVTPAENLRRSPTASTLNIGKQFCVAGHEFTAENTYTSPRGKRQCRRCRPRLQAAYRARKRAQGDVAGAATAALRLRYAGGAA